MKICPGSANLVLEQHEGVGPWNAFLPDRGPVMLLLFVATLISEQIRTVLEGSTLGFFLLQLVFGIPTEKVTPKGMRTH